VNSFDVAIIGGGVIGCSIALELAAEKLNVVVLDRDEPARGASWAAAGMLSPAPDSPESLPLVPFAKESLRLYPEFIAALEEASGLSTGFARKGTLAPFFASDGESQRDRLVAEYSRLGIPIEPIPVRVARELESGLGPAARAVAWLPDEATVDPRLLMAALLTAISQQRVKIRSGCTVASVLCESGRCTGVMAGGEGISANTVVVAAGCYSATITKGADPEGNWLARYAPTHPVRGQMMALRSSGTNLRRVLRSERGYVVPRPDGRIVAGSTLEDAGFENHVTPEGMLKILDAALELVPALADAEVKETWSGLRPGSPDHLPILGPTDIEGLFIATGHYRNGILLAPATAKLLRDCLLSGKIASDADVFSPMRFTAAKSRAAISKRATALS
jgi:glycine oxidase